MEGGEHSSADDGQAGRVDAECERDEDEREDDEYEQGPTLGHARYPGGSALKGIVSPSSDELSPYSTVDPSPSRLPDPTLQPSSFTRYQSMMAPVRSSARPTLAKTVAASPAASQTRPTRAPTKLVQRTLTTSLGLSKDPPPVDSAVRQAVAAHLSKSAAGPSAPFSPPIGVDLPPSMSSTSAPPPSEATLADFHKFFPTLKEDQLPLVQLELETVGRDWLEVLSKAMETPGFLQVRPFCPPTLLCTNCALA